MFYSIQHSNSLAFLFLFILIIQEKNWQFVEILTHDFINSYFIFINLFLSSLFITLLEKYVTIFACLSTNFYQPIRILHRFSQPIRSRVTHNKASWSAGSQTESTSLCCLLVLETQQLSHDDAWEESCTRPSWWRAWPSYENEIIRAVSALTQLYSRPAATLLDTSYPS